MTLAGERRIVHFRLANSGPLFYSQTLPRGHASENPDLPDVLAEHNIRFLGPGSKAMAALGDKVRSMRVAGRMESGWGR
jgi:hypothetical protein